MLKKITYLLVFLFILLNLTACSSKKVQTKPVSTVGKGNTIDCSTEENKNKSGCQMEY